MSTEQFRLWWMCLEFLIKIAKMHSRFSPIRLAHFLRNASQTPQLHTRYLWMAHFLRRPNVVARCVCVRQWFTIGCICARLLALEIVIRRLLRSAKVWARHYESSRHQVRRRSFCIITESIVQRDFQFEHDFVFGHFCAGTCDMIMDYGTCTCRWW